MNRIKKLKESKFYDDFLEEEYYILVQKIINISDFTKQEY